MKVGVGYDVEGWEFAVDAAAWTRDLLFGLTCGYVGWGEVLACIALSILLPNA